MASATFTSGISARIRPQMRCAVCRCLRGAFWSASRISSMNSITGPSFACSRTGVLRSAGIALSTACRTIRRCTPNFFAIPESCPLHAHTPAGSPRIAPPCVSCPSASPWATEPEAEYTGIWFSVRWGQIKVSKGAKSEYRNHFRQRELLDSNMRITYSTKKAYAGYLTKWIVPRWGQNALQHIKAREVELWLASVQRARTTRAKIRNVMSVLFNHARRYDLFDVNPIQWVRQSAKRRSAPNVLTIEEVRRLLAALPPRERILVFLDVSTGLRQSELFGLQWQDIDFEIGELRVTRSVVGQVVGTCKTEASQKAIPLHEDLIEALKGWRQQNPYKEAQHWVFASPSSGGKNPYWGQQLMRRDIRPVAEKLGITKRIGWHTFRHTYSTLLRAVGADLKVMQELLRHSTIRVTLDTYTQAVTAAKRTAHTAVVSLIVEMANRSGLGHEGERSAP